MKKQSAITLVALIITIIILLILATVSISLVINGGIINRAKHSVDTYSESELEEKLKFAFSEAQMLQYTGENNSAENSLKEIFENVYGKDNVTVSKAGKNYKVKVNNSKTAYRISPDGSYDKYEEMDSTSIYARLDDEGTLYLRATQPDGYNLYTNSDSIKSNWNTAGDATKASVQKVIIEEPIAPINAGKMFYLYSNLKDIENIEYLHTENITAMDSMFQETSSLENLNVSKFDTCKVTTMARMFNGCNATNGIDVTGFDTQNVTNMSFMFYGCSSPVIDVSNFNTGKVTSMGYMLAFTMCKEYDLSKFDTNKVSNMYAMLLCCSNLETLYLNGKFCINDTTNITHMFTETAIKEKIYSNKDTKQKITALFPTLENKFEIIE